MSMNKVCNVEDWKKLKIDEEPKRRKTWEVQMALDALKPVSKSGCEILGVGAGYESTIFHLCNTGARVWATDIYVDANQWSNFAPISMLTDPSSCSPFPFDETKLITQHMDMRHLRCPDNYFDGVFSSGSIEHVGDLADVANAAKEIGRVLKPGGTASISTEFKLSGDGYGWDGVVVFDEEMLNEHIIKPSGLKLTSKLDLKISKATLDTAYPLSDFVNAYNRGIQITHDDVVLSHDGILFTSIHLVLTK